MSDDIRPFSIDVPDSVIDDLRARLHNTRWPDAEPVDDWSQGVPLAYVRDVCAHWADHYDWRRREAALNRFDQFVTEIDGVDIHFVHQRSPHPDAMPLLITHGWPGSIVEFQHVIEPLTDPPARGGDATDAFHVIAPSLPGFGFSGTPTEPGWTVERIADVWTRLMARLGYDRYVAQGGDWGSAVTGAVGAADPEHCVGVHMSLDMTAQPAGEPTEPGELRALEKAIYYQEWDSGYSTQQKTRPQTLGYGLSDSPAGQAAWILEKMWAWTDCGGDPESVLDRDDMLDNIMIYWVTGTATSSARIYWESFGRVVPDPVTVHTGFSVHPEEIVPPARSWSEGRFTNIAFWREHDRGGHFAAWEIPNTFVGDMRDCFRPVR